MDNELTWFVTANNDQINTGLVIHAADIQKVEKFIHSNADSLIEYRRHQIFKWGQLKLFLDLFGKSKRTNFNTLVSLESKSFFNHLSLIKR